MLDPAGFSRKFHQIFKEEIILVAFRCFQNRQKDSFQPWLGGLAVGALSHAPEGESLILRQGA